MIDAPVSVIIVSRGRPQALVRCLIGLEQLFHECFEVIVVSDPRGMGAIQSVGFSERVKCIPFDVANISAARNLGIAAAAGQIIAFIDDDAVPEPTWLAALTAPFVDVSVAATGGYVRGRNGISFQFRGAVVDSTAADHVQALLGRLETQPGRAVKTMGTNCAFRRDALEEIGGFDDAFHFYLDETDVNMRIADISGSTVIVPEAEVHHGFHGSGHRRANRVPRSLYEIGASLAVFLRKHFEGPLEQVFDRERAVQRTRLDAHHLAGRCEPRDVRRLMQSLEQGFIAGQFRALRPPTAIGAPTQRFLSFAPRRAQRSPRVISGRNWDRGLWIEALNAAERGERISLFRFSPTALYHRVSYAQGIWVHTGGIWGRSERSQPLLQAATRRGRLAAEIRRVSRQRGLKIDDSV